MSATVPFRILIVDDDVALGRVMREALSSQLECEVDCSPNPEYAFELALKKRFSLFIFDFSMPMIDGALLYHLLGKVFNHVNPPLVVPPLILISGRGEEERARELLKEPGVRAFIAKPFPMNRLIENIRVHFPDLKAAG